MEVFHNDFTGFVPWPLVDPEHGDAKQRVPYNWLGHCVTGPGEPPGGWVAFWHCFGFLFVLYFFVDFCGFFFMSSALTCVP